MDGNRIFTEKAPRPIGPYSQAIQKGNFLFISGQIPLDPFTNELVKGGIKEQTDRALKNLLAVLESAGMNLSNVTMTFVYLADMRDFSGFNQVYSAYFSEHAPARITVAVKELPKGCLVEIAAIAMK